MRFYEQITSNGVVLEAYYTGQHTWVGTTVGSIFDILVEADASLTGLEYIPLITYATYPLAIQVFPLRAGRAKVKFTIQNYVSTGKLFILWRER